MRKILDLTNKRFNRLLVTSYAYSKKCKSYWNCKCDCGKETIVMGVSLNFGKTQSCGCLQKEKATKHGKHKTKEYAAWTSMVSRCTNANAFNYSDYGGRGITVSEQWTSFENFYNDMGDSPKNMSLDRINNDGNYCKENCRWATEKEQHNNTRSNHLINYKGKTLNVTQWSEELGINRAIMYYRINKCKWTLENILTSKGMTYETI